jgi:hypothetical protein
LKERNPVSYDDSKIDHASTKTDLFLLSVVVLCEPKCRCSCHANHKCMVQMECTIAHPNPHKND